MLFYDNLEEIIFHRHEHFDVDELVILSGYVGPQPVNRLKSLPFKTSVIYGMYGSAGISEPLHSVLKIMDSQMPLTNVYYSNVPIHAKCYIWKKNNKILTALVGSANFSTSGLSTPYKEVLAETNIDSFSTLDLYLKQVLSSCIDCADASVNPRNIGSYKSITSKVQRIATLDQCHASLLDRSGKVSSKSGLNWGLSPAHTTNGDAYIAIRKEYLQGFPDLFPPKQKTYTTLSKGGRINRQNDAVELIWDDGTIMEGLLEGSQDEEGVSYPKQICSSPKKNIFGLYIRKRLGVPVNYRITRDDLELYGRTDIDISKQGEGIYYMDFSQPQKLLLVAESEKVR